METDDARMTTIKDLKRFEKEKQFMASRISELESQVAALRNQVDEAVGLHSVHAQELLESKQAIVDADNRNKINKEIAVKFEKSNKEKEVRNDELEKEVRKVQESLHNSEERVEALEAQIEQVGGERQELIDQNELINKLKKQLGQATMAASREQNDVQNALQSTSMMLQELKLEYERFTETSRTEFRERLDAKDSELEALRQRFERNNQVNYENARHMLLEQKELVGALKSQFDEYRNTAEHMFMTEARKMEGKLSAQSLKHELEMQYAARTKDLHFRRMVTAKDAKIMNLIEGTDLQAFLIKHEIEIDHLRRQHERDLEIVKEEVEEAQIKQFQQLQNKIAVQELDIEKSAQNVKHLETKLSETLDIVKQSRAEMLVNETAHVAQMNEMQEQVRLSQQLIDNLTRGREALRHRLVRLKLKMNGEGKDDLESLLKRLTIETERLSGLFEGMILKNKAANEAGDKLRAQRDRQREISVALKTHLHERTQNLTAITKAFERFLKATLVDRTRGISQVSSAKPYPLAEDVDVKANKGGMALMSPINDEIFEEPTSDNDFQEIYNRLRKLGLGIPIKQEIVSGSPQSGLLQNQLEAMAPPLAGTVQRSMELARPHQPFRHPARLKAMMADQSFVRQNVLDDLKAGFDIIKNFNAITMQYMKKDISLDKMVQLANPDNWRKGATGTFVDTSHKSHNQAEATALSNPDQQESLLYGKLPEITLAVHAYEPESSMSIEDKGESNTKATMLKTAQLQPDFNNSQQVPHRPRIRQRRPKIGNALARSPHSPEKLSGSRINGESYSQNEAIRQKANESDNL